MALLTFKANSKTLTTAFILEIFFSWIRMRGSSSSYRNKTCMVSIYKTKIHEQGISKTAINSLML